LVIKDKPISYAPEMAQGGGSQNITSDINPLVTVVDLEDGRSFSRK